MPVDVDESWKLEAGSWKLEDGRWKLEDVVLKYTSILHFPWSII
tara:strand:+ start:12638 stop:12769 length:132 start_codon:yes stop_codon:yes gene_type:complete